MNARKLAAEYKMGQWVQIIQDRKSSGKSVKDFCRDRNISKDSYFYWQKKLRDTACERILMPQRNPQPTMMAPLGFTEVKLLGHQPMKERMDAAIQGSLTIDISGLRMIADYAYPADQLAYLLRELVNQC